MRLDPKPGERILDLSTGTGWTSRLVAGRGAAVIGADIAADLLEAARPRRKPKACQSNIGDAEGLPFEDAAFDAVVSTCGVMFAVEQEAAAAELWLASAAKAYIALTTWLADSSVVADVPGHGKCMPPPPSPPPRSPFEWGRIERIRELLGNDFDLRFEKGVSYYREPTAEAAWETFSTGYGPTRVCWLETWSRTAAKRCAGLHRIPRGLSHGARDLRAA